MRNRADNNQFAIVNKLRKIGASVTILSQVGDGCPDLLVGFRGVNYLMEIKERSGKLTTDQQVWHTYWNGQVAVVRSFDEAIKIINKAIGE